MTKRLTLTICTLSASLVVAIVSLSPALALAGASSQSERQAAYRAGLAAYVHGFPPLISRSSQAIFPVNSLVGVAALSTPANKIVVLPNVDTVYTVSRLDLRAGPLIVSVPPSRHRYYVLQLMDAYTNVFGYIGTRTTGPRAGSYAIVGPSYRGPVPGYRTFHSPTPDALLLGRTLVKPGETTRTLAAVLGTYAMTPLSTLAAGAAPRRSLVITSSARGATPPPATGTPFLSAFDELLGADPPSAAEARALAALKRFGIGAGAFGAVARLPADVRAALIRGVNAGPARVAALAKQLQTGPGHEHAGWELPAADIGRYGADFNQRAATAHDALWANTAAEAVYFMTERDGARRTLTGRHRYVLRFAHRLPAKAFWSVTIYDADRHLYANPLHRYALGDRSLPAARDGSYTVRLQHRAPASGRSGWLPAPPGHFIVVLRLYVPTASVLRGRWRPPGIGCADCAARRR
jgi:hypothetical protein